jgi:hypothetical protein
MAPAAKVGLRGARFSDGKLGKRGAWVKPPTDVWTMAPDDDCSSRLAVVPLLLLPCASVREPTPDNPNAVRSLNGTPWTNGVLGHLSGLLGKEMGESGSGNPRGKKCSILFFLMELMSRGVTVEYLEESPARASRIKKTLTITARIATKRKHT